MNFARYPNYAFLQNSTHAIKLAYAHTTVVSCLVRDPRDVTKVIPLTSFQNYSQSVASARADNSGICNSTAIVSLDQLFRPYTLDQSNNYLDVSGIYQGSGFLVGYNLPYMPRYKSPSSLVTYSGSTAITSASMNPFPRLSGVGGHDCEWVSSGPVYSGLHTRKKYDNLYQDARSIGLKSPAYLVGWGYNIAGNPVPHASGDDSLWATQTGSLYLTVSGVKASGVNERYNVIDVGNTFAPHAWEDCTKHPAGPLDVKWNKLTGTWQSNGMIKGKLDQSIPAVTGVADMSVWINGEDCGENIRVKNWYSSSIAAGTKVMALWDQIESYWYIGSADCG